MAELLVPLLSSHRRRPGHPDRVGQPLHFVRSGGRTLAAIDGISDSVLSDRLSDLAARGLITRTVDAAPPITVSYALTDRGRALIPALDQIALSVRDHVEPNAC